MPEAKMLRLWRHAGLRVHLIVPASIALGIIVLAFVAISTQALSASTRQSMQERLVLAQVMAYQADVQLDHALGMMRGSLNSAELDLEDGNPEPEKTLLKDIHGHSALFTHIILLDVKGTVLWVEPYTESMIGTNLLAPPFSIPMPLAYGPVLWWGDSVLTGKPAVVARLPVVSRQGGTVGYLFGWIDMSNPQANAILYPYKPGSDGYTDLVDDQGVVLASTQPERLGQISDHAGRIQGLISENQAIVGGCHSCHDPQGSGRENDVLAFAPLSSAPWGIVLRQPEEEILAPTRSLAYQLSVLGLVVLATLLGLAWATTRGIVGPLQQLTQACRRITAGDLSHQVPTMGVAEASALATSFEEMRRNLLSYQRQMEVHKQELERRVEQRTAELAHSYEALQTEERARGELLHRVLNAQEEERKRIARELHDETCQTLTALMLGLDTTRLAMRVNSEEAVGRLDATKAMAGGMLEDIRRLVADLRPSLLDDLGLVPAILWYGEKRLKPLGIELRMETRGLQQRVPPTIETALFRIVQEAMSNVARHAEASMVAVTLARNDGHVSLIIRDDGKGFRLPPEGVAAANGHGMGLRGMLERASNLGGSLALESAPGEGTSIDVRLPIEGGIRHAEDPCIAGG
jgi:signal transduction histidine kinase